MRCEDCDNFVGQDREDGHYICGLDDTCPYEEEGEILESDGKHPITVSIDEDDITNRISSAFQNALATKVYAAIDKIIKDQYDRQIREMTEEALQRRIDEQIDMFLSASMSIGGGWNKPAEEITREEYLSRTVQGLLSEKYPEKALADQIGNEAKAQITKWSDSMKRTINARVNELFNEITRQNLTDNFVSLLMSNETYKTLQNSVKSLLG